MTWAAGQSCNPQKTWSAFSHRIVHLSAIRYFVVSQTRRAGASTGYRRLVSQDIADRYKLYAPKSAETDPAHALLLTGFRMESQRLMAPVLALGRLLFSVLTAMVLARPLRDQPMVRWLLSGVSSIGCEVWGLC